MNSEYLSSDNKKWISHVLFSDMSIDQNGIFVVIQNNRLKNYFIKST